MYDNICLFNKRGFHQTLFLTILNHFPCLQRNEHVEMNNFSCSLSCTWMTVIDCLFYASGSLSSDVSREYIAKLLVVWL